MDRFEQTLVTVIPLPPDLVERDRRRRAALRMTGLPGLAPVTAARIVSAGLEVDQVLPSGAGRPYAAGSATQALALLAPVAHGLALAHDAGLVHGGVMPEALWVNSDGTGLLAGWTGEGDQAADVAGIAALADAVLPVASVGADVAHALVLAADPDPAIRPTMARVAAVLDAARRREAPASPPAVRRTLLQPVPVAEETFEPPVEVVTEPAPTTRRRRERGRHGAGERPARAIRARGIRQVRPRVWAAGAGGLLMLGVAWVAWPSAAQEAPLCPVVPPAAVSASDDTERTKQAPEPTKKGSPTKKPRR